MTAFAVARNSQPLHGHSDRVDTAVFDPSGMRVLTASTDRTARIWDAHTGRQLMLFAGHRAMLTTAVFHRWRPHPDHQRRRHGPDLGGRQRAPGARAFGPRQGHRDGAVFAR